MFRAESCELKFSYSRQHLCKPPCRYARRPKFLNPRSNKQTNKSAKVQNFSLNVQPQITNLQVINRVYVALTGPKSIPSHCKIGQGAHDVLKAFYLISLPAPTFFHQEHCCQTFFVISSQYIPWLIRNSML